ncbi:16S rRNA (cytosine(967)-C(5))-methyltransferase RsmB [Butyrivibrio sp. MB2005]|uniref:16S rRNA (cytosine(967)-C(5))-methyltransferase RsmB n=1 Tax=Butyrivibrio sp. MB2005 TaxID=1280678 RepID=UPI0003FA2C68|nr:16S rRNA (cytosine(967)-C(5))-methyltransferase RsmB [Butyrivibrio sp. MB2005]
MAEKVNERKIALDILLEMEDSSNHEFSTIKRVLDRYDYLDTKSKAFIKYLAGGTVERKLTLDYVINQFSKTPTEKMALPILLILRMSVYQILFMDSVPDSAAVNEAVKLTAKRHFVGLKGFVNGVLRNISRKKDKIDWPEPGITRESKAYYLSIKYSQPEWLAGRWIGDYGIEQTEKIFRFFLKTRPVSIRFSRRLETEELKSLIAEMKKANNGNIVLKMNEILPYAMDLYHTDNIRYLPGYDEGAFLVQDISSMLVCELAGIKTDNTVVDVCSAPGGKSLHAADKLKGTGQVIARDLSANKCMIIRENVNRMRAANVTVEQYDAEKHDEKMESAADVLLCDLPCSGLGVIGRKPDIKMNTDEESIRSLQEKQRNILNAVWNYVKPGGIMMYSTCTVAKEENEDNVKWILENLPFEPVDLTDKLPEKMKSIDTAKDGYIQILPGEFETDGFFIAKFRRKE